MPRKREKEGKEEEERVGNEGERRRIYRHPSAV